MYYFNGHPNRAIRYGARAITVASVFVMLPLSVAIYLVRVADMTANVIGSAIGDVM